MGPAHHHLFGQQNTTPVECAEAPLSRRAGARRHCSFCQGCYGDDRGPGRQLWCVRLVLIREAYKQLRRYSDSICACGFLPGTTQTIQVFRFGKVGARPKVRSRVHWIILIAEQPEDSATGVSPAALARWDCILRRRFGGQLRATLLGRPAARYSTRDPH